MTVDRCKTFNPAHTKGTSRFPKDKRSAPPSYNEVLNALNRGISLLCFLRGSLMSVGTGMTASYMLRITSMKARNCSALACHTPRPQAFPHPEVTCNKKG